MRKKILILIPILLFLVALPVSLLMLKKQQDTRSRASTTEDIIFSFSPNDISTLKNKDISIDVILNTQNKPVNTIEFKLTYDKDLLELKSTTNGTAFDSIFDDTKINNSTGTFYYAGTGDAHHDITGTNVKVTTLLFHTKTPTGQNSEAELGFTDLKAGAAATTEDTDPITHTTTFTAGNITVAQDNACDADTGRPLTCACEEDGQCESGGCDNNICVPSTSVETCESLAIRPVGCACTDPEQCASNVCGEDSKCGATPTGTCTDGDGGLNYNVKSGEDSCYQGSAPSPADAVLIEYYCDTTNHEQNVSYDCPNGCLDGKCTTTNPPLPTGKLCRTDSDCPGDHYCPQCGTNQPCETPTFACQPQGNGGTPIPTPTTVVIPTATLFPTPTLIPGEKRFKISVVIPGIGTGENITPIHPQRKAKIQIYNQNDDLVKELTSSLLIDTDFRYKAIVGLGTTFPNGPYLARLKLSNSLSKQSSSILQISDTSTADTTTTVFNESLILGDINHDNELSILDYSLFLECTKNAICDASDEGQKYADLNDDGKVGAEDLNLLYIGFASRTGE